MKGSAYPELALVLWAAKKVGRPVKWIAERSESFIADHHARDNVSTVELALDDDRQIPGAARRHHRQSRRLSRLDGRACRRPTISAASPAPIRSRISTSRVTGVFSNTNPTCPYRGAGRPEASYCIERIIDIAARETGIDPVALRRRNMIPPTAMPYKTGLTYTYDSGEFETAMDMALELADWQGVAGAPAAAKARGKLYGVGIASVIEIAGGPADIPLEEGDRDPLRSRPAMRPSWPARIRTARGTRPCTGNSLVRSRLAAGARAAHQRRHRSRLPWPRHFRLALGERRRRGVPRRGAEGHREGQAHRRAPARSLALDIEFADGRFTVAGTDRSHRPRRGGKSVASARHACRAAWSSASTPTPS